MMVAKWAQECPACGGRIKAGDPIKRYVQRVGGWGDEGRWSDTGKFRHVTCPKVSLPRRHAPRVSSAQLWDADNGLDSV